MARYLNVLPGKSRAAFISYGRNYQRVIGFNSYTDLKDFDRTLDSSSNIGGKRRIDRALKAAVNELGFSNPLSHKVVIVMTSGRHTSSRDGKAIKEVSDQLHRQGTLVYVIAIGENPSCYELRPTVDHPEDIFLIKNYKDLVSNSIEIASDILRRSGKIV